MAKTAKRKGPNGKEVEEVVMNNGQVMEAYSGNATECAMLKFVNLIGGFAGNVSAGSHRFVRSSWCQASGVL